MMRAMADVRIEHVFNCSADTFWEKIFLEEEFNRRLFTQVLGFPVWKEVKREETADELLVARQRYRLDLAEAGEVDHRHRWQAGRPRRRHGVGTLGHHAISPITVPTS